MGLAGVSPETVWVSDLKQQTLAPASPLRGSLLQAEWIPFASSRVAKAISIVKFVEWINNGCEFLVLNKTTIVDFVRHQKP